MSSFLERIRGLSQKQLAVLALRLNEELEQAGRRERQPIAVVGIGCRFPGGITGPDDFWRLLDEGREAEHQVTPLAPLALGVGGEGLLGGDDRRLDVVLAGGVDGRDDLLGRRVDGVEPAGERLLRLQRQVLAARVRARTSRRARRRTRC